MAGLTSWVSQAYETARSVMQFGEFEHDADKRHLIRAADVSDLRRMAKRRMPGGCFDYIDGAAEDEVSAERSVSAYHRWQFRPRVLRDVSEVDISGKVLGTEVPIPLVIAPTGFDRIAHSQGELAVARAAERAGIPYSLSTMGTRSVEEVAEACAGRKFFQVYVWRDRELMADLLERSAASGYEAIMITVDTAVLGRRERDVRHGFSLPPKLGPDTIIDGLLHPRWLLDFLSNEPIKFSNCEGAAGGDGGDAVALADYINSQFDPSLSWDDIEWFRERWDGPVMLKGVLSPDDAKIAADMELDAVIVSNHGGRQLDGAPAPVECVPAIREAVGDRCEVICDGGIRRGSDIVKALALGADSAMIGRAYLYALGAAGETGVDWVLNYFVEGMTRTMRLNGVRSTADLTPDLLERV
ncbi:alpha-hydroxy acid oxidase [Candidatus Poriferisodalis sp.]|uniref:alpha-hydroxy acid oxidase n=1 Tax=Candidatus Poriferisodalis sp. TaxID=3101277 RepID=UPI003B0210C2